MHGSTKTWNIKVLRSDPALVDDIILKRQPINGYFKSSKRDYRASACSVQNKVRIRNISICEFHINFLIWSENLKMMAWWICLSVSTKIFLPQCEVIFVEMYNLFLLLVFSFFLFFFFFNFQNVKTKSLVTVIWTIINGGKMTDGCWIRTTFQ